jgi:hypothetical protein
MSVTFSTSVVSSVVGFLLSILVENVPGFVKWWTACAYKVLIIAGAGLVVTAALVGLGYAGAPIVGVPKPFIWDGLVAASGVWISFVLSTQAAYQLQAGKVARNRDGAA